MTTKPSKEGAGLSGDTAAEIWDVVLSQLRKGRKVELEPCDLDWLEAAAAHAIDTTKQNLLNEINEALSATKLFHDTGKMAIMAGTSGRFKEPVYERIESVDALLSVGRDHE